ncbi:MAG: hypothetical protein C0425_07670 [Chlorobiaceae bacterium]|nr:hypothetical protein [Chlorobiaceae bacterium]MBA4310199.1 hypothetical protein [Chlorobiaceae bacterium]
MTKTQIWTAGFLLLFTLLFFLQKATSTGEAELTTLSENYGTTQSNVPTGDILVKQFTCTTCHGGNLQGTAMGPTLYNLSEHYDRDKLINYLRNPQSFIASDRMKAFREKYKNVIMPSYNNKDVKELGKIADYLLQLK